MQNRELTILSLIVIRTANIETSLSFYRAIGIAFIREQHGSGPVHFSCDFGGLVLELYPSQASSPQESGAHTTMLGFKVASLEGALAELHKLGIQPKFPPKKSEWGRWVDVTDPNGCMIQINEVLV